MRFTGAWRRAAKGRDPPRKCILTGRVHEGHEAVRMLSRGNKCRQAPLMDCGSELFLWRSGWRGAGLSFGRGEGPRVSGREWCRLLAARGSAAAP